MLSQKSRKTQLENIKIQKKLQKIKEDELCILEVDKSISELKETMDKWVLTKEKRIREDLKDKEDCSHDETLILESDKNDKSITEVIFKHKKKTNPLNRQLKIKSSRVLTIDELDEISLCNEGCFFVFNENKIKMTTLLKTRILKSIDEIGL